MPPQSIQEHKEKVLKTFRDKFVRQSAFGVTIASLNGFHGSGEQQVMDFLSRALDEAYKAGTESVKKKIYQHIQYNPHARTIHSICETVANEYSKAWQLIKIMPITEHEWVAVFEREDLNDK